MNKTFLPKAYLPYGALLLAVIFWGFSFIATKIALQSLTPFCLIFLRFSMASVFFAVLLFGKNAPSISRATFKKLAVLAIFQPGLYFFFETYGLKYTTATKTALIITTIPIVVLILSTLLLKERLRPLNIIGVICSIFGVSLLIFGGNSTEAFGDMMIGDMLIAGAVLSAAIYTIFARHLGQTISPLQITGLQIIFGTVLFLPFFVWDAQHVQWADAVKTEIIVSVLGLTVFATIGAFSCFNYALSKIEAARASVVVNAIPLVTAFGAWLLLGETLTVTQMMGGVVVISAVCLANYRPPAPTADERTQKTNDPMVMLDHNLLIGRGTLRTCYRYPDKSEMVIKVQIPDQADGNSANQKEWKSYQKLIQSHSEIDHISHCHGFIATNRGPGLICDCIRDADERVSDTLWDIVVYQEDCDLDYVVKVADKFCMYLIINDIFLFDINLKNIAYQKLHDGSYKPYAIDLKGPFDNKEFLQLSSRIKFLGRRKLKRRARQLLERIVLFREQRESLKTVNQNSRR